MAAEDVIQDLKGLDVYRLVARRVKGVSRVTRVFPSRGLDHGDLLGVLGRRYEARQPFVARIVLLGLWLMRDESY